MKLTYLKIRTQSPEVLSTIERFKMIIRDEMGVWEGYCDTKYRGKEVVEARQLFMYITELLLPLLSYAEVGYYCFPKFPKDHGTVINAKKVISNYMATDKNRKPYYEHIIGLCIEVLPITKIEKKAKICKHCGHEI